MQRQLVALACSGLFLTLAACGGGGGEPVGGNAVFVKPANTIAITQTLTVSVGSESPVYTMALPTAGDPDALATSQSLSDGTTLTMTSLTGQYQANTGDTYTVRLQVSYVPDTPSMYIIGLTFDNDATGYTCISSGWSAEQFADPLLGGDGTSTPPTCDGTVTIDTKKSTIVAQDVTTLIPADAASSTPTTVNFAVALPQP